MKEASVRIVYAHQLRTTKQHRVGNRVYNLPFLVDAVAPFLVHGLILFCLSVLTLDEFVHALRVHCGVLVCLLFVVLMEDCLLHRALILHSD